jgi:RNA ligase (TIGR02306 family)
MERKLASIQRIREIRPIDGADMIELAIINSWQVVVAKDAGHKADDLAVYCEIDSMLPIREEFEFLRKSSYKKMADGAEGFRLRTVKLKGQVSQGLVLPLSVFGDIELAAHEGLDVTQTLGITKYEPPIPAELSGKVKGYFPSFINKTDEERIQNMTNQFPRWIEEGINFCVTEKLDGSSATYYVKDGVFGVCSRNLELADPGEFIPGMVICSDGVERPAQENTFWKVARELDIKTKLLATGRNLCLQGELIGEGIQGNPYRLKGQTVKFYNAFDIDALERLSMHEFLVLIDDLGYDTVPVYNVGVTLPSTIEQILKDAEGKSALNPNTEREGLVIRSLDTKISFKVISNKFLLKNEK